MGFSGSEKSLERLAAAGIQLLPAVEISTHYVFERDGFVALVERTPSGFGGVGSAGILTGSGFAALIRRGDQFYFVARNFEREAPPAEVDRLRSFSSDLKAALDPSLTTPPASPDSAHPATSSAVRNNPKSP
jgi:hypothetical protein